MGKAKTGINTPTYGEAFPSAQASARASASRAADGLDSIQRRKSAIARTGQGEVDPLAAAAKWQKSAGGATTE
jgi:hypothetical protein